MRLFLFFILFFCLYYCNILEVYIIPHSHCDVGWKKTVDEYYNQQVHWILHNATRALSNGQFPDVTRKFNWDVQTYFQRWFESISESHKNEIRDLVNNGQLSFVGFGWVQSDEGAADAFARILQMTEGHNYIAKQFPEFINQPRIAWQIDPFGASSLSPVIFSLSGYDALVHERIPRALQGEWKAEHRLQYKWTGNPSTLSTPLWSHNLGDPTNDYCTPGDPPPPGGGPYGFDWEADDDGDPNKDPVITPENIEARSNVLVQIMHTRSKWLQPGVPLLFPFGCDFRFQKAEAQYSNMDQLIHYINQNSSYYNIHLQYGLVSEWYDAVMATNKDWPGYEGDFLPYNNKQNDFWSGCFTSRPDIKISSRYAESLVRYADALYQYTAYRYNNNPKNWKDSLDSARQNVSICQHHDAITGTSPDTTMEDYLHRLRNADLESSSVISGALNLLLCGNSSDSCSFNLYSSSPPSFELPQLIFNNNIISLIVMNTIAWERSVLVEFYSNTNQLIITANNKEIPSYAIQAIEQDNGYLISFIWTLYAMEAQSFYISNTNSNILTNSFTNTEGIIYIENNYIKLGVNTTSGTIFSITELDTSKTTILNQEFIRYYSPNSSAYSMKPSSWSTLEPDLSVLSVSTVSGETYSEISVIFSNMLSWKARVISSGNPLLDKHVELSILIGPLENDTEISMRYNMDWETNGIWFSDNGIAMDEHNRVHLLYMDPQGIGSNFHPLKTATSIKDFNSTSEFIVFGQQSAGTSSLSDGQLEIMIHRRVGSWVDHTTVNPHYKLLIGDRTNDQQQILQAKTNQQLQYPPIIFTGSLDSNQNISNGFKIIPNALPDNIHLFSLSSGDFIINITTPTSCNSVSSSSTFRLQNLSKDPITLNLLSIIPCDICYIEERGLTFLPLKGNNNQLSNTTITLESQSLRSWFYKCL